jgi:hypothetical protein
VKECFLINFVVVVIYVHLLFFLYLVQILRQCSVDLVFGYIFRMKELKDEPYTQEEAERAAGMGSYKPHGKVKVVPQDVKEAMEEEEEKDT